MVSIFGIDVDLLSLIPALFGALLSLYNWWQMSQPAKIFPNPFFSYGLIASSYQEGMLLCFPIVLSNEGAHKGMVTEIRFQFKNPEGMFTPLDLDGKAQLLDLNPEEARMMDWQKFENHGYIIKQPTYPIVVPAHSSVDVYLIARSFFEDREIPIEQPSECQIEVFYDHNKHQSIRFPFYLPQSIIDQDDQMHWLSPLPSQK